MKISNVSAHNYYEMTIENGPYGKGWTTYRRNGPDNWEVLMGESWETVHNKDLEAAFVKALAEGCSVEDFTDWE